jgi:hypothetical protein
MLPFIKSPSAFPPPPRIGKGEKFPSGWFGDLWNWIKSSRPLPDNVTIFGTPTVNGVVLSAKIQGGGIGGGSSSDYSGYFTVIANGTTLDVINGADSAAAVAGYVRVGTQNIAVPKVTGLSAGSIYARIYLSGNEYAVELTSINGAVIDAENEHHEILYDSAQVWQDGVIDLTQRMVT